MPMVDEAEWNAAPGGETVVDYPDAYPDEAPENPRPFAIPVAEFEGEFVRQMDGKLPGITLEMPEGYKRGTHLILNLEVRVRDVSYHEQGKDRDLVRQHTLALEEVVLADAFDPDDRPNNVGGTAAGGSWLDVLGDWLEGKTETLDFEGEEIPERLQQLLEINVKHEPLDDPEEEAARASVLASVRDPGF